MKIIEPNVELWEQGDDKYAHVAKCARICYRSESNNDDKLIKFLLNHNHLSMFRHCTYYYLIPRDYTLMWIYQYHKAKEMDALFVGIDIYWTDSKYLVVANGQWVLEHPHHTDSIKQFEISEKEFANYCEVSWNMMRYTFKVVTQISTSRELNRVSPNNIAEQSTRYVYEDGTLCRPHWLEGYDISQTLHGKYLIYKNGKEDDDINHKVAVYIDRCDSAFNTYKCLIAAGLHRQDARGVLPIDTATICAYTYSWREWEEIIKKRVYNTTGKAHPNATIICKLIEQKLNEFGYKINI